MENRTTTNERGAGIRASVANERREFLRVRKQIKINLVKGNIDLVDQGWRVIEQRYPKVRQAQLAWLWSVAGKVSLPKGSRQWLWQHGQAEDCIMMAGESTQAKVDQLYRLGRYNYDLLEKIGRSQQSERYHLEVMAAALQLKFKDPGKNQRLVELWQEMESKGRSTPVKAIRSEFWMGTAIQGENSQAIRWLLKRQQQRVAEFRDGEVPTLSLSNDNLDFGLIYRGLRSRLAKITVALAVVALRELPESTRADPHQRELLERLPNLADENVIGTAWTILDKERLEAQIGQARKPEETGGGERAQGHNTRGARL